MGFGGNPRGRNALRLTGSIRHSERTHRSDAEDADPRVATAERPGRPRREPATIDVRASTGRGGQRLPASWAERALLRREKATADEHAKRWADPLAPT